MIHITGKKNSPVSKVPKNKTNMKNLIKSATFLIVMMGLMVEDPNFVQPYIISIWVYFALIVSSGLERDGRKGLSNA